MRLEPTGDGGLADAEAVADEEIGNRADALPLATQFPNDFVIVIELRAGWVRRQPLRFIKNLVGISHWHSCCLAGNRGKWRIAGRERVGRIGIELFGPWEEVRKSASGRTFSQCFQSSKGLL